MTDQNIQQILEDVAAGRLDPAEASRLIDAAGPKAADGSASTAGPAFTGKPAPPAVPDIERILVRATSRRVRIVGDPSVATVAIEGQHQVRRDGSTLVVTGEVEPIPTDDAFTLLSGGRWREVAGRVQVEGARALDHLRVTAGSLRVRGAENPFDLLVQAGSAQVEARLTRGHSRMRCESGSLQLSLLPGSDVRVRADVQLGRFVTEPERHGREKNRDVVVGTGAAEVDAEVVMGSVTVKVPG